MKQPHEDVTGISRDDYLLSLDDAAIAHRDALIAMASFLRAAALAEDPIPLVALMFRRIALPAPGDLVVESSATHSSDPGKRLRGLGILIEHRSEWEHTDEEWATRKAIDSGLTDDDRPEERASYIQYGPEPGDVCRWVNCEFTVLPISAAFIEAVSEPDNRVVTPIHP